VNPIKTFLLVSPFAESVWDNPDILPGIVNILCMTNGTDVLNEVRKEMRPSLVGILLSYSVRAALRFEDIGEKSYLPINPSYKLNTDNSLRFAWKATFVKHVN
jgi:hypothetical protein